MNAYQPETNCLHDRTILVTGAGDGIGKAVAKKYAALGATVILLGRTTKKLEVTYDEIVAANGPQPAIFPMQLETAYLEHYHQLANTITKEFGMLHGVVHCATNLGSLTPLALYDAELWYKVFQVDVHAAFFLTQACLPCLGKAPNASVIFSCSDQAEKPTAYWGAYGISQSAIRSMMQIFADEHEQDIAIRFNCVNPGPVATLLRRTAFPGESPDTVAKPEDVTLPYIYLMSDAGAAVSGRITHITDPLPLSV